MYKISKSSFMFKTLTSFLLTFCPCSLSNIISSLSYVALFSSHFSVKMYKFSLLLHNANTHKTFPLIVLSILPNQILSCF